MDNENNNDPVNKSLDMSDIFDQTTLEYELGENSPAVQPEGEGEISNPVTVNVNNGNELFTERRNYSIRTVTGENYIVQGTSNRTVQVITLDRGGNPDTESENETEVTNPADYAIIPLAAGENVEVSGALDESTVSLSANRDETNEQEEIQEIHAGNSSHDSTDETDEPESEREKANLIAWKTRSAKQKAYQRMLRRAREDRIMKKRCMSDPGMVVLSRIDLPITPKKKNRRFPKSPQRKANRSQSVTGTSNRENSQVVVTGTTTESETEDESNETEPEGARALKERSGTDTDSDGEIKFVGTVLNSESRHGGENADGEIQQRESKDTKGKSKSSGNKGATSRDFLTTDNTGRIVRSTWSSSPPTHERYLDNQRILRERVEAGFKFIHKPRGATRLLINPRTFRERLEELGNSKCKICQRQFLTIADLERHLEENSPRRLLGVEGCQHDSGPRSKKPKLDTVYSNVVNPWPTWLPEHLRCRVDLKKLNFNRADHAFIKKKGFDLSFLVPSYRSYDTERLPVLVSGYDFPEETDSEYYNVSDSETDQESNQSLAALHLVERLFGFGRCFDLLGIRLIVFAAENCNECC